jgi:hypothetical protein
MIRRNYSDMVQYRFRTIIKSVFVEEEKGRTGKLKAIL